MRRSIQNRVRAFGHARYRWFNVCCFKPKSVGRILESDLFPLIYLGITAYPYFVGYKYPTYQAV